MDENSYNLSDLFKSPFGPTNPRNWEFFGPSEKNLVPFTPREYALPLIPNDTNLPRKKSYPYQDGMRKYFEKELEKLKKPKIKEKNEVTESRCQCGRAMQPIVVEVSFRLKNPEVIYVGDIFIEYCPACQDEQFLALSCKEASHKFLTTITKNKK